MGSDLKIELLTPSSRICYSPFMARKPRIEYDGALYHVITRGTETEGLQRTIDFKKYSASWPPTNSVTIFASMPMCSWAIMSIS